MQDIFSLKVVAGPGVSNNCILSHEHALCFGREETNDYVLSNDAAISRKHFEISFENGKCFIRDLNSRNGTFLNDEPVLSSELKTGDEIRVGATRLVVAAGEKTSIQGVSIPHRSKISVREATTVLAERVLYSGKISKRRIMDELFLQSFVDLPGCATILDSKNMPNEDLENEKLSEGFRVAFPKTAGEFSQLLDVNNESGSLLLLNHTSARSDFVAHLNRNMEYFSSRRNFLIEYQELPTEISLATMNGIDLVIGQSEKPDVADIVYERWHAKWLGKVIAADKV